MKHTDTETYVEIRLVCRGTYELMPVVLAPNEAQAQDAAYELHAAICEAIGDDDKGLSIYSQEAAYILGEIDGGLRSGSRTVEGIAYAWRVLSTEEAAKIDERI